MNIQFRCIKVVQDLMNQVTQGGWLGQQVGFGGIRVFVCLNCQSVNERIKSFDKHLAIRLQFQCRSGLLVHWKSSWHNLEGEVELVFLGGMSFVIVRRCSLGVCRGRGGGKVGWSMGCSRSQGQGRGGSEQGQTLGIGGCC